MTKPDSFKLRNGLTVINIYRPGSLSTAIHLDFIAGSQYEEDGYIGVAHFLEHLSLDGSKNYSDAVRLKSLVEESGGRTNAFTSKDLVAYYAKVLTENYENAFEYISQVAIHPLLRDSDIFKEKKIISNEFNRILSNPETLCSRLGSNSLYEGTRLGGHITGDINDIERINRKQIENYHRITHCAENGVLVISGGLNGDTVKKLSEKYFGEMSSGSRLNKIQYNHYYTTGRKTHEIPGSVQSYLNVCYRGYPASSLKYYQLKIIADILGRGTLSRIYKKIRLENSLAYYALCDYFGGRNHGVFSIKTGLSNENIDLAINIIRKELIKFIDEGISIEELNRALNIEHSSLAFLLEDTLDEAGFYASRFCLANEIANIDGEFKKYARVVADSDAIREAAKEIFSVEPSIYIVGKVQP